MHTGNAHSELAYADDVQAQLEAAGWRSRPSGAYSPLHGLLTADLLAFLEDTQPGHLALAEVGEERFAADVRHALSKVGTAHALKHGLDVGGRHLRLCGFKPQYSHAHSDYPHNRFSFVRELVFTPDGAPLRLDFALFLNGIPLFTFELKSELSAQTVADAMEQYRRDRKPELAVILEPCVGAIAHFAVSQDEANFTTRLCGEDTAFLPFNPGAPYLRPAGHAYPTDYLWRDVLTPDGVLELLQYFVFQAGPDVLFPRFHQWECVQQVKAAVMAEGVGQRYLQQHSAGSGKSNTIAWLAFQLAYLTHRDDTMVFDKVLVVTDRLALDRQLGGVLRFMRGTSAGQMVNCAKTKDLLRELAGSTRIVVTTIQKFAFLQKVLAGDKTLDSAELGKVRRLRFAVLIDEAHSSQGGDYFARMTSHLTSVTRAGRNIPNVSFFAFTATPKRDTLELFGRKNRMGELAPFHSYSMQQAIDEKYILDVREGYLSVKVIFVAESTRTGEVVETERDVFRHIFEDPAIVRAKASETVRRFRLIAPLLEGKAQAMVVCESRKAAALFKLQLDALIAEQALPYATLAAFTGDLDIEGRLLDEFSINGVPKDTDLGKLFRENPQRYKFLVVADKFQVGFDCPRLMALFVAKGLEGLTAVQTLSRLNRVFPGKDKPLVVDFVNDEADIMEAFDAYIDRRTTVPRDVLPRLAELHDLFAARHLYEASDIDAHWTALRTAAAALYAVMEPLKRRIAALPDKERNDVVEHLVEFKELYSFGSKVHPEAFAYQREAALVSTLVRYVDKREAQKSARLPLKVVTASIVEREPDPDATGALVPGDPLSVESKTEARESKSSATKALENLLLDLSRKSYADLADAVHQLIEELVADGKVASEAQRNVFDVFAREGQALRRLEGLVAEQAMTAPGDCADALVSTFLGGGADARAWRDNLLRVVYLRATSV